MDQTSLTLIDNCLPYADRVSALAATLRLDPEEVSEDGFLVTPAGRERYASSAEKGRMVVALAGGEVAGYAIAIPWREPDAATPCALLTGVGDLSVDLNTLPNLVWFDQVGVAKPFHRSGVGRALLTRLLKRHEGCPFISGVVEAPYRNSASIRFHEKNGFVRIGTFRSDQFEGICGFQSATFLRWPGA